MSFRFQQSRTAAGFCIGCLLWAGRTRLEEDYATPYFTAMELIYPINFVGHDEWVASGYSYELASGDVISRDGEVLGTWRVVNYDLSEDNPGGRYEFIPDGQSDVKIAENIGVLDSGLRRGLALSQITRKIREWHETPQT